MGVLQAYYLARAGAKVVLIDAFGVGSGLSGAASGYVPMNCYPCDGVMGSLARTSFHLQFQLADELDGAHVRVGVGVGVAVNGPGAITCD